MHDQEAFDWRSYLVGQGHGQARLLGKGMEGVVYGLRDATVAKVWHRRKSREVRKLAAFYAHLAAQELPFQTPEFLDVHEHAGQVVSVERGTVRNPAARRDVLRCRLACSWQGMRPGSHVRVASHPWRWALS